MDKKNPLKSLGEYKLHMYRVRPQKDRQRTKIGKRSTAREPVMARTPVRLADMSSDHPQQENSVTTGGIE